MIQDPHQNRTSIFVTSALTPWPPLTGPGSDREVWVAFAREVALGCEEAREVLDEQSVRIASLEAKLAELRVQLAEREPAEAQRTEPPPTEPPANTLGPSTFEPVDGERSDDTPRDT